MQALRALGLSKKVRNATRRYYFSRNRPRGGVWRRNWAAYARLGLLLTFSAAIILFGHHPHRWWRAPAADDPFPSNVTGFAEPIDGDSLWVGENEIRLKGIDAPEWKQLCERDRKAWNCGEAARDELVRTISNDAVTCTISERDVYGRLLGHCHAANRDLNANMVSSGMAVAYGDYRTEQNSAKSQGLGLWAGEFDEPRDWRAQHAWDEER